MSRKPRRRMPPAGGKTSAERLVHEDFARRLQKLMNDQGMNNSDLARKTWGEIEQKDKNGRTTMAARNRDRIGVYLSGKGFPDPKNLGKLARALGTTPEELAPDITAAAIEREVPEMAITTIAGTTNAMLRINKLVPLSVGAEVIAILAKLEKTNVD